jgi:hypothetical protein
VVDASVVAQVLVVTARVVVEDPLEEVDAVVAPVVTRVVTSVLVDAAVVEASVVSPVGSVSDVIV